MKMIIDTYNLKKKYNYKYERELSKFDARHNFLLNRSANVWNTLPNEIVQTTNLNTFKNLLDNFNY